MLSHVCTLMHRKYDKRFTQLHIYAQTALGGVTTYHPIANFLCSLCAKK